MNLPDPIKYFFYAPFFSFPSISFVFFFYKILILDYLFLMNSAPHENMILNPQPYIHRKITFQKILGGP